MNDGKTRRQIRIGDDTLECARLESELLEDIQKLSHHLESMRAKGADDPKDLKQMQDLLSFREAVLEWLRSDTTGDHHPPH